VRSAEKRAQKGQCTRLGGGIAVTNVCSKLLPQALQL
jgi:hypothetical protein